MLKSASNSVRIIHPRPEHFKAIQDLCKRVYPFTKPWSIKQLEAHHQAFPGGQLIALDNETGQVLGLAFSLIVHWDSYSPQDGWTDFTSNGFFYNHDPVKGKTLYGAEVMVDPNTRGRGIGKLLYEGRQKIVEKYELKRVRAGARLIGYSQYKDKMTPYDYVIQVIEKKIIDPTLSFQLGRGFKVIDVVKDYLPGDPDSLGYAAVIERLNPKQSTKKELKLHTDSVEYFLTNQKFVTDVLPRELHRLVRKVTNTLGDIIREEEGDTFYADVENYRLYLKKMRNGANKERLVTLHDSLTKESNSRQLKIAHAFALQLEIVNACETTYRTWKLKQSPRGHRPPKKNELTFVLTAHPSEARSSLVVNFVQRLVDVLLAGLQRNFIFNEEEIKTLIRLLWSIPLAKKVSPSPVDEAEYLFSLLFSERMKEFIFSESLPYNLKIRTWVGGDKDGHPRINSFVMKQCLSVSRKHILLTLRGYLEQVINDLSSQISIGVNLASRPEVLNGLKKDLLLFEEVDQGDGLKIKKWCLKFRKYHHQTSSVAKYHHQMMQIENLLKIFPAFVVPLEIREDAQEIKKAITDRDAPIRLMLRELRKIAGPLEITEYVRGFVISHCETVHDLLLTTQLVTAVTKTKTIPVIPLFETAAALRASTQIMKGWLSQKNNLETVRRHWKGYVEIMLGYSDSAKEMGVLPSRRLIYQVMHELETVLATFKVKPIFFHGSGGSVARGGGSIKNQIAWWPNSALDKPKLTIQGEMVQRTFATQEILSSYCSHIVNEATKRRGKKPVVTPSAALDKFVKLIEIEYSQLVGDQKKLTQLLETTPYRYLNVLKIGSRPSKRMASDVTVNSLRAIPWVLCWTQSRLLLPTWWGIGSAWKKLDPSTREELKLLLHSQTFFSSFIKSLGFTLAKVEIDVWKFYAQVNGYRDPKNEVEKEFKATLQFMQELTGETKLIWHRPWLEESIRLRSPHVHILNLLQIIAMQRSDEALLRETLVGVSCGMLTTG